MTTLRWLLRPSVIPADMLLIGGLVVAALDTLGASGPRGDALRLAGLAAATYGGLWIVALAGLSSGGDVTARRIFTRVVVRFADAAAVLPVLAVALWGFSDPNSDVAVAIGDRGFPAGILIVVIGYIGILVGWVWIRRIARGAPDPEAHDAFWWSRA